jgi:hypothetical protein
MRKAQYDMQRVICKNASCIGYSSNVAKPGYWVSWRDGANAAGPLIGRVIGRIAKTDGQGNDCAGFLAVMSLGMEATHAWIRWVDPADVTACYEKPPADLLAWITGNEWVKNKGDIARMIAMSEHGTLSESFIATRNDPSKPYNSRPAYVAQFILE